MKSTNRPSTAIRKGAVGAPVADRGHFITIEGIEGAEADPEVIVFHAGTGEVEGRLVTAGGRVVAVTARGPSLVEARDRAYRAAEHIQFEGAYMRRDIGAKGLQHVKG